MQPSEEIKSRLNIVDVLRDYIQLKAAGSSFRANCPFHREKTPSFMVSPEKQIWHCFGCGKGGDVFSFVMQMEGIEFVEAMRLLAPKAGVELKAQDPAFSSKRNRALDVVDLSRKYFHKVLLQSKAAESARKYLKERGLSDDTIEEWQIGYSMDTWDSLMKVLRERGFTDEEIFYAGMSSKSNTSSRYFDRFRGRIMFPINDANGNVIAFTARVSPEKEAEEKMGKYINSPQTAIYDKSKELFGLDKAKQEIRLKNEVIIVEGQMDVITAHQAGYKNVVASSGTALTPVQVKQIQRFTNNLLFALDSDDAGQAAIDRGEEVVKDFDYKKINNEDSFGRIRTYVDPLLSHNINIKVIEMPGGKDPDECIRNNPKEWEKAVANARSVMEHNFEKIVNKSDLKTIEGRREVAKRFLTKIAKLGNKIEQSHWLQKLSEKIDVAENILRETLQDSLNKKTYNTQPESVQAEVKTRHFSREERLSEMAIALILRFPALFEYSVKNIQVEYFIGDENKALYKNLIFYYNNHINNNTVSPMKNVGEFDYGNFAEWIKNEGIGHNQQQFFNKLLILGEKDFCEIEIEKAKEEIIKIVLVLKKYFLLNKLREVEKQISLSEKSGNKETIERLLEEFKALSDEMRNI